MRDANVFVPTDLINRLQETVLMSVEILENNGEAFESLDSGMKGYILSTMDYYSNMLNATKVYADSVRGMIGCGAKIIPFPIKDKEVE